MKFRFNQEKVNGEYKLFISFENGERRLANDVETELFKLLDYIKQTTLKSYKENIDTPLEEIGLVF